MKRLAFLTLLLIFALAACGGAGNSAKIPEDMTNNAAAENDITEDAGEDMAADDDDMADMDMGYAWPAPQEAEPALSRNPATEGEIQTQQALAAAVFPLKDQADLVYAFGLVDAPIVEEVPETPPVLNVGVEQLFWIQNGDTREWEQVPMRLEAVSEHAYLWFDTRRELREPDRIQTAAANFDSLYEIAQGVYGMEDNPGIDGDPRVYILHVAAVSLCNVDESTEHQCGLAGFFSTQDTRPIEIEPRSNEHEMFVLSLSVAIGGENYSSVLIHEFRHMIENNYPRNEDEWSVEGTAVMAQTLLGDWNDPNARASQFLANTDVQLNGWTSGNTLPHYGKGYLFARYIQERIGLEGYSDYMQRAGRGFALLDEVLADYGYEFSAVDLWLDWASAISVINAVEDPAAPFSFGAAPFSVDDPFRLNANKAPMTFEEDVQQFAFDIYDLRNNTPITIDFTGTTKAAVLENVVAASGEYMWYSGRANEATMTLTHAFDLSGVDSATLHYDVNYKIEGGWDFVYTLVSTDGGTTWEALAGEGMDSDADNDDPAELSLADTYFTGVTGAWTTVIHDLTSYAGGEVLVRFQYVTDAVYTQASFVLDNIAIPEIDFYDDVEAGEGDWAAEGFTRVTSYTAQPFHLVLIQFDEAGLPFATRIALSEDNTTSFDVPFNDDIRRAFLVVAAANPVITSSAAYQVDISQ